MRSVFAHRATRKSTGRNVISELCTYNKTSIKKIHLSSMEEFMLNNLTKYK